MNTLAPESHEPAPLEPAAPAAAISALPALTNEQKLSLLLDEQKRALAEALEDLRVARHECEVRGKKIGELEADQAALKERLAELQRNSFLFELLNHDAGSLVDEAGQEFEELCRAVQSLGSKGTFTLKLAVKAWDGGTALVFAPDIAVKAPKAEPFKQILFLDADGKLTRESHEQRKLL